MKQSAEQKRWSLILADPQSPLELRAQAQKHLKIETPRIKNPSSTHYTARLDEIVQSYWGTRQGELEQRDFDAERVYQSLVTLLILGGNPNTVTTDTEVVLAAFAVCRSSWMRRKAGRALLTALVLYGDSIPTELRNRVETAIDSIGDFDLTCPDERDWLSLTRTASNHETAHTQNT
jgi:hypothetical protein